MNTADLTDAGYAEHIAEVERGILLFHKKLCPHCLNMMKVIEKFVAATQDAVSVMYIDSEDNPGAMRELSVQRVPTLFVIKAGKVAATKVGLMNPRELGELYRTVSSTK